MKLPAYVKVLCSDGGEVEVTDNLLKYFKMIKALLDDLGWDGKFPETIPLPTIHSSVFSKALEYVEHHKGGTILTEDKKKETKVEDWDKEFLKKLDVGTLFEILIAADLLGIEKLLHSASLTIAGMIKGKSADEIRESFGVTNDFSEEEEKQIENENRWLMEK